MSSMAEVRILRAQNPATEGQRALTFKQVPKIAKGS